MTSQTNLLKSMGAAFTYMLSSDMEIEWNKDIA